MNFSISINNGPLPALYPGGVADAIDLKLSNPNAVPIYVTGVTVALRSVVKNPSAPANLPCGTGDFTLKFGQFVLGGIGTATFGAILLYALLNRSED